MSEYKIISDSGCDIAYEDLEKWGVPCIDLTLKFEGEDTVLSPRNLSFPDFYQRMRDGGISKTAACNPESFRDMMEPILKEGLDILYVGFSSGLSTTANNGAIAAAELMEEYPERKISVVDTLAASAGQGLLLYYAVENRKNGMSLEENAKWLEDNKLKLCHWFTVSDLIYLKRGGRINAASYFAATVLDIKPVLHVDDEGHLISMSKVRGRKKSLQAIADKFTELAIDPDNCTYFISHGDCLDDAKYLESLIEAKHGHKATNISYVGPVIGSHSGPGTIALFFLSKHR